VRNVVIDFQIGQIVISKAGKDKGDALVVLAVEGEYLLLCDGLARPLERPKRKKIKHVQPTNSVDAALSTAIAAKTKTNMKNADFKTALKNFGRNYEGG